MCLRNQGPRTKAVKDQRTAQGPRLKDQGPLDSLSPNGNRDRSEVLLVPSLELLPRVGMTLGAEVLERVGRREGADASAVFVRQTEGHPLHRPSAFRVT